MTTRSWQAFPARQLTGRPFVFHAYVGRERPEQECGHDHRNAVRAEQCAARLASRLNARKATR
jgi:hypothetical protein